MKRNILLVLILLAASFSARAELAMGEWQMHFAYNDVQQIEQSKDKVYAVSNGALFSVDKVDESMEYYSKLSGLNATNITCIKYDEGTHTLLIVYENGNIDLLKSGGVENIADLYNKIMSSSKAVNDAVFNGNNAYLATDFGVLVLNIAKHEIANTYYIGDNASDVKVISITVIGDIIYAASESAIYYANIRTDNLVDYTYWKRLSSLPGNGKVAQIKSKNGKLYVLSTNNVLATYADNTWTTILGDYTFTSISSSGSHLFGSTEKFCYEILDDDASVETIPVFYRAKEIEYDAATATYWFAAHSEGIGKYVPNTGEINKFAPNGPCENVPFRMSCVNNKVFVVPGGRWATQYNNPGKVMMYENGTWTNIETNEITVFDDKGAHDFMNVAADPSDNTHFFVTSYANGLYEFKNNKIAAHYYCDNSIISSAVKTNYNYVRTDGAVFDSHGNLWFLNEESTGYDVLYIDGADGTTMHGLNLKEANGNSITLYTPTTLVLDNRNENFKWYANCRYQTAVVCLDDRGTPATESDDRTMLRTKFHDQKHNEIAPEYIYCITQDRDGNVWVGTSDGPFYIAAESDFFSSDAVVRVIIDRNDGTDLGDYLLAGETINAIAVDGANRKWFGTSGSGVYLMSEDGTETIHHFTDDNSPLPTNNILSITINDVTGEVFFGTGTGLVSFQSDASEPETDFSNVYAYPNPVRPDYAGLITVAGLTEETSVYFTDIAGNAVYSATSNGGLAVWDGKDAYGHKVASGVYQVQCVGKDGKMHTLTKILIMN